jgi:hypothetical protein
MQRPRLNDTIAVIPSRITPPQEKDMHSLQAKFLVLISIFHAGLCFGASEGSKPLTVSSGSMFRVEVTRRIRLQEGRVIQGRLLEPMYAENRLAIPSGALLEGMIAAVRPAAHGKRLDAEFHGDFTPLGEPIIQWTVLSRSDGSRYPLLAESAAGVGSTLYFRSAHSGHPSLIERALLRRTVPGFSNNPRSRIMSRILFTRLMA